jgi:hypothetical protein
LALPYRDLMSTFLAASPVRRYWTTIGSDLVRDGMFAELWREALPQADLVAEAFWSDVTNDFTLTLHHCALPVSAIELFLAEARASLPPKKAPIERNRIASLNTPR